MTDFEERFTESKRDLIEHHWKRMFPNAGPECMIIGDKMFIAGYLEGMQTAILIDDSHRGKTRANLETSEKP